MRKIKLRKMVTIAMLIALSAVGALIKIPSPVATVSLDSLPGFVAAGLFSPVIGGCVGAVGHLISALITGFPMGIAAHIIVAVMMFIAMAVFSALYKKNKIVAVITAIVLNGPVALAPFGFIFGWGFFTGMILPLSIAAVINVLLAVGVLPLIKKALAKDSQ